MPAPSELAPQNAAIGWLRLQLCAAVPACDSRDVATVLRWVDPDNGAAWLHPLATAHKDGTRWKSTRMLADMARGDALRSVLQPDHGDDVRRLERRCAASFPAASRHRIPATAGDLVRGRERGNHSALFAVDRCLPGIGAPAERREDCLKLAKIMQRGDTIIVQMVGFGIERRLVAPDSKEARSLAERRRMLEWRMSAAAKFDYADFALDAKCASAYAPRANAPAAARGRCLHCALREHKMPLEPAESHP